MLSPSRTSSAALCAIFLALCCTSCTTAAVFEIMDILPIYYREGDVVPIHVNSLQSIENVVPYDYYYAPFCRPKRTMSSVQSLGQMLNGERIRTSPYVVNINHDVACRPLTCDNKMVSPAELQLFEELIEKGYRANMVINNLPGFSNATHQGQCGSNLGALSGYPIGVSKRCHGTETLLNNHLHFRIQFRRETPRDEEEQLLVVGFTIEPYSIRFDKRTGDGQFPGCDAKFDPSNEKWSPLVIDPSETSHIPFTFGVTWVEAPGDVCWATRWDAFLQRFEANANDRSHWIGILETTLMNLYFITFLLYVARRDLTRYNTPLLDLEVEEGGRKDCGWKAIHADVFRPPQNLSWFITLVCSGFHIVATVSFSLLFAALGLLMPGNRGGILTAHIVLYALTASGTGYVGARLIRKLGGDKSWGLIAQICTVTPGIIFSVFLLCNTMLWRAESSAAVSVSTILVLLFLWMGMLLPLGVVGAALGYRVGPGPHPRLTNSNPRLIDTELQQPWFIYVILTGAVPFLVLQSSELEFITASLWQGQVYVAFGFLAIVFALWLVAASLASITSVYYRLNAENYHWWWISFWAPSSFGIWLFAYWALYFALDMPIPISSTLGTALFFIYMGLVTFLYVLASGCVGFLATFAFVTKIYGALKID